MKFVIKESAKSKFLASPNVNYALDKITGDMYTWGKTPDEDPTYSPVGPFIADIEVTTKCAGITGAGPCSFCYKSNTANGINMPFTLFKEIFDKMPKAGTPFDGSKSNKKSWVLTQIAFGADAKCESNPEIWDMMDYCRENGVVPNITVADISEEVAEKLAMRCGAVSVSYYGKNKIFLDTIKRLHEARKISGSTLQSINVHQLFAWESKNNISWLIENYEKELKEYIGAIVFLSLKKRGRGVSLTPLTQREFTEIVERVLHKEIPFGFDSCSCNKVAQAFIDLKRDIPIDEMEPCESTCISSYFSASGHFYPCSFNEEDEYGIHISEVNDFFKDLWFHKKTTKFRTSLLNNIDKNGIRGCPTYEI